MCVCVKVSNTLREYRCPKERQVSRFTSCLETDSSPETVCARSLWPQSAIWSHHSSHPGPALLQLEPPTDPHTSWQRTGRWVHADQLIRSLKWKTAREMHQPLSLAAEGGRASLLSKVHPGPRARFWAPEVMCLFPWSKEPPFLPHRWTYKVIALLQRGLSKPWQVLTFWWLYL